MSLSNNNKRKGKNNTTGTVNSASKSKPRSPKEKLDLDLNYISTDIPGIYNNPSFMHASATVVGCLCHLQVTNGNTYEGIFLTFSNQLDVVLSMVIKLGAQIPPSMSNPVSCVSNLLNAATNCSNLELVDIMVFAFKDITRLHFIDVDLDFAIKGGPGPMIEASTLNAGVPGNFTDTSISKFNGQVLEKELEPWEGGTSGDGDSSLLLTADSSGANGWDVNEMFRTNAEKYGVTSTYDDNLTGYTMQLEKKNTAEYKRRELEAIKVANEIDSSATSKSRLLLENGDDDKSSAVVRPENTGRYVPPSQQGKRKPMHSGGQKPGRQQPGRSAAQYRSHTSPPHTPPPPVRPISLPSAARQPAEATPSPMMTTEPSIPPAPPAPDLDGEEQRPPEIPSLPSDPSPPIASTPPTALPPRGSQEKRKDSMEKKGQSSPQQQKSRDEIEDLKKFQAKFKNVFQGEGGGMPPKESTEEVSTESPPPSPKEEETSSETPPAEKVQAESSKSSSKPFVWNLNAKSFTPRNQPVSPTTTPPVVPPPTAAPAAAPQPPPPRLAPAPPPAQQMAAPAMAIPPQFLHHYVTPIPQPFVAQPLLPTNTRMKKIDHRPQWQDLQQLRTLPATAIRHDLSSVAAATGPPILTPPPAANQHSAATVSAIMQYHHSAAAAAGNMAPSHPYSQMYQMMGPPRIVPPPPVPMVPSNHSTATATYGGDLHAASIFVTHPGNPPSGLPTHAVPVPGGGSNPPTPQTAPSPVHQPQTPTPNPQPPPLMYSTGYGGAAPMVLMSHPPTTGLHPAGLHGQATPPGHVTSATMVHSSPFVTHHQDASHGLHVRNWVPIYVIQNEARRSHQVEPQPPGLGAQQEHN